MVACEIKKSTNVFAASDRPWSYMHCPANNAVHVTTFYTLFKMFNKTFSNILKTF